MNVVAKLGPVAAVVAASPWPTYAGVVFDEPLLTSSSHAEMNHAVVIDGYGSNETTGDDYWPVGNSWGGASHVL